jgi:hypothetical protein
VADELSSQESQGPATVRSDRQRWERAADTGSIVWGLILVGVGAWFFFEVTLGYDLPAIDWGVVWPIAIILIGGWILLRAAGRRQA